MHDDDLHPDHELASASLDGDVTEVQRAQVEASPELSALVATMRDVRSQLADVPPASAAAREAALAAMFAEFDATSSGADEPPVAAAAARPAPAAGSNVVSLAARRQWSKRIMSAAAGLLVVGAVGVAIKGGLNSSSDSKASSATFAPQADRTGSAGGNAPDVATPPPATIGSIMVPADVAVEINDPQGLLDFANERSALTSTKLSSEGAPEGTAITDAAGTFAGTLLPTVEVVIDTLPPEISSCVAVVGDTSYLGMVTYKGIRAYAVVDTVTGEVTAITESCNIVATAKP